MSGSGPGFDQAIQFARDLIRIPSPSGGEGEVAARVMNEMTALGLEEVRTDALGSVVGVVRGRGKAPPILLNAHIDVVAVGDERDWEHPPFGAEVTGGFLHGRGAMDIKGPLALVTHAAASLRGTSAGDLIVAHTVYEERGGWGMERLLEDITDAPAAALVVESTHGDVTIGHRGRAEIEIVLSGLAGHASAPERARNALALLPDVLAAVEELGRRQPADPILGSATMVATQVDVRPESRNVIPDEVIVALDCRILPGTGESELIAAVGRAIEERISSPLSASSIEVRVARQAQRSWTGVDSERSLLTPGFLLAEDAPVAVAAARAAGKRGASDAAAHIRPWTFATDGGWTCGVHGIPTVGFAPGEERFAHTNRERLDLEEARWAYGRYPAVISAIQAAVT